MSEKKEPKAIANEFCRTVSPVGGVIIQNKIPAALLGYSDGKWWGQDLATTLAVTLLYPQENELTIELYAAPGGKTMQLAQANARMIAVNNTEARMKILRQNLERTNLSTKAVVSKVKAFKLT